MLARAAKGCAPSEATVTAVEVVRRGRGLSRHGPVDLTPRGSENLTPADDGGLIKPRKRAVDEGAIKTDSRGVRSRFFFSCLFPPGGAHIYIYNTNEEKNKIKTNNISSGAAAARVLRRRWGCGGIDFFFLLPLPHAQEKGLRDVYI